MASLATNFTGFILFFPVGIRRLLSSSSLYLHNPSHFRSKLWYFSDPKWKNLDLYFLLISLPIVSFSEFFLFLSFSRHPTYRFSFFQQSFVVLAFWVMIILIIGFEYFASYSIFVSESFVFVFGGVVFLLEYSVMDKGISGVAGVVYGLLGGLSLVCAVSCFYLSAKPNAFFAEFLLCCGLVFKGTWLLQIGVSLYTNVFGLKGCQKISIMSPDMENVDVKCDLDEDNLRGVVMMQLLFTLHAVVVLFLGVGLFGVLASNRNLRGSEAKGPLLAEIESTDMRMCDLSELEMG